MDFHNWGDFKQENKDPELFEKLNTNFKNDLAQFHENYFWKIQTNKTWSERASDQTNRSKLIKQKLGLK